MKENRTGRKKSGSSNGCCSGFFEFLFSSFLTEFFDLDFDLCFDFGSGVSGPAFSLSIEVAVEVDANGDVVVAGADVVDEKASVELSMPSVVSLTAELLELDENSIFEDNLEIYT